MQPFVLYIILFLATKVLILLVVNIARKIQGKKLKWTSFPFSDSAYYLFLASLFIPFIVLYILFPNPKLLIYFLISGVAGMIGETLFAWYWDSLYRKRFWIYKIETIFHSYSSWLNFLPWAFGGIMYLTIAKVANYTPTLKELGIFWLIFLVGSISLFLYRKAKYLGKFTWSSIEYGKVTWKNYTIVSAPIYGAFLLSALVFLDYRLLIAGILFGLVAWIAEYLFGKLCEKYLSKRLWVYTAKSADHGHITPLSIIPFAGGGVYFITIFTLVSLLF